MICSQPCLCPKRHLCPDFVWLKIGAISNEPELATPIYTQAINLKKDKYLPEQRQSYDNHFEQFPHKCERTVRDSADVL